MNSKQLSSKRKKARKRWRVFFMVIGSIGLGIVALGFAVSMTGEDQPVSKFYSVGLALATLSAMGYGLAGVTLRVWPRRRRTHSRRSRSAD